MRFFKSKLQIILSSAITILAVAAIAGATTIGTNITTDGTLTVVGNVGIGTTSPVANLVVSDYNGGTRAWISIVGTQAGTYPGLTIERANFKRSMGIFLIDNSDAQALRWFAGVPYRGGSSSYNYQIGYGDIDAAATVGSGAKLTLLTTGNVGIGTTSPYAKLSVTGTTAQTGPLLAIDYSANGTATSSAMYINSSGNVGIGTTNPTSKLQIVTSDATEYDSVNQASSIGSDVLEIWNTNTSATNNIAAMRFVARNSLVSIGRISLIPYGPTNSAFTFQLRNGGSVLPERMRITSGGNVGIGTTSPAATLDVEGYMRLKKNLSEPAACSAANGGAISLNSNYYICICNGTSWVNATSTATCVW